MNALIGAAVLEELNDFNGKTVGNAKTVARLLKSLMLYMCELAGYYLTEAMRPTQICEQDLWRVRSTTPARRTRVMRRPSLVNQTRCVLNVRKQAQQHVARWIDCTFAPQLNRCIQQAYVNGAPTREICMSLPAEQGLPKHLVANQTRCVYDTKDARMIWEHAEMH